MEEPMMTEAQRRELKAARRKRASADPRRCAQFIDDLKKQMAERKYNKR